MKRFFLFSLSLMAFFTALAQSNQLMKEAQIEPYSLEITWDKTTVLVFPSAVKSADRGSRHILAQKDQKVSNILRLKAGQKNFTESNLSVVTADGNLYHFTVNYQEHPAYQMIDVGRQKQMETTLAKFKGISLTPDKVDMFARAASVKARFLKKRTRESRITLSLKGIYVHKEVMFFHFALENDSRIDYNFDQWRFYIRDRRQVKRTAIRESELEPLHTFSRLGNALPGKGENTVVVAFQKFTIADDKKMVIQLLEASGDRNLTLEIKGKHLLKARPICLMEKQ